MHAHAAFRAALRMPVSTGGRGWATKPGPHSAGETTSITAPTATRYSEVCHPFVQQTQAATVATDQLSGKWGSPQVKFRVSTDISRRRRTYV